MPELQNFVPVDLLLFRKVFDYQRLQAHTDPKRYRADSFFITNRMQDLSVAADIENLRSRTSLSQHPINQSCCPFWIPPWQTMTILLQLLKATMT